MLKNISPDESIAPISGEDIKGGEIENVDITRFNRLECPIKLKTNEASFDDISLHALLRQRLSENTIEKRLRYARFMEHHIIPVDFREPTIENFTRHMDYREQIEKATPNALVHEWKTMRMFLKAYGIPLWDYKAPIVPKSNKKILPFPETAREFWHYNYSIHKYERKLYQYLFFFSFMVGVRNPSELVNLKTTDIIFNKNKSAILTITETKKHNSERSIILPYELACDPRHKSLQNWLTSWRPRVEKDNSEDFLFIQPNGKPFTGCFLRKKLSEHGKRVWPYFHPYVTRHWNAVAKLIEQRVKTGTFDCLPVRNWLGHEQLQTTMTYVKYAEQYYNEAPYDWLKRALKRPSGDSTLKFNKGPKNLGFGWKLSESGVWARRDVNFFTGEEELKKNPFLPCIEFPIYLNNPLLFSLDLGVVS